MKREQDKSFDMNTKIDSRTQFLMFQIYIKTVNDAVSVILQHMQRQDYR